MDSQITAKKLGIIGGGQLAQMLIEAARPLGIPVRAFIEPDAESAATMTDNVVRGLTSDTNALREFLSDHDVIIFESEFAPVAHLREASAGLNVTFLPSLATIGMLQNKLSQKEGLKNWGISTSPFIHKLDGETPKDFIIRVKATFPTGTVLKWATLGYDGKGVFIARDQSRLDHADPFIAAADERKLGIFAEQLVPFSRELACIGVRSIDGSQVTYPVVISEQHEGICYRVFGPATEFGLPPEQALRIEFMVKKIGEQANLIGAYGVELFETNKGEIFVNEIAPRVHNTGHYTQDASATSQFENHLRATLSLPLGDTKSKGIFLMQNILGPDGVTMLNPEPPPSFSRQQDGVMIAGYAHWYGKSKCAPRRKLGHMNGFVPQKEQFDSLNFSIQEHLSAWEESIRNCQK